MSATVQITIVCDACGRTLPTTRTKVAGARGDADREQNPDLDRLARQLKAAIPERQETDDER